MKKPLLVTIIFLFSLSSITSQVCFPDHGTWNQKYHSIAWGHGGEVLWDETTYNSFRITGDTISGDSTFFKLVKNQTMSYYVYEEEDKVFVGTQPDSLRLWFDYSLNPGETFQFHAPNYSAWPYVLQLEVVLTDSVMVAGVMRKHIVFEDIPGYGAGPEWIQGIGDINFGGLEMDYSYVAWYGNTMTLECFTQSGFNIYGVCTLNVDEIRSSCLVSPNPSAGVFRITYDCNYPLHINVFHQGGENVYSGSISTSENSFIDLSAYPPGFYFMRITDKSGKTKSQKILIQ